MVANTPQLQAVLHTGDGVLGEAVYAAGAPLPVGVVGGGGGGQAPLPLWSNASFSSPGAFLLAEVSGGGLTLAAAQPAQCEWSVNVSVSAGRAPLSGPNCTSAADGRLVFSLPFPPSDGSTAAVTC